MSNIKKNILKKIKEKKIKPISKNYFRNIELLKVFSIVVISLLGGLIVSLIYFYYQGYDKILFSTLDLPNIITLMLPIKLFLLLFLLFISFFYIFRKIGNGYKKSYKIIFLLIIVLFTTIGYIFYIINIETKIINNNNIYEQLVIKERKIGLTKSLQREDKGLYTGIIKSINNNTLEIIDIKGNISTIDYTNLLENIEIQNDNVIKINGVFNKEKNIIIANHIIVINSNYIYKEIMRNHESKIIEKDKE